MSDKERFRVLFVDDEPMILDGLKRQLRGHQGEWDMRFAESGPQALKMLEAQPAGAIVSDMRMPMMSGLQLLDAVHDRWPETVRIILSGQTDQVELLSNLGVIHQFLQKPCDALTMRRAIARAASIVRTIETPMLRRIVTGIRSLPVLADSLRQLMKALEDESSDIALISHAAEKDVGLSAKLLQLVNSAFFGHPRHIHKVKDAITLIGLATLKQVAVTAATFDALAKDAQERQHIEQLWFISADVAAIASSIAQQAGQSAEVQERTRLAGTLSLIGRAVLCRCMPAQFERARRECTLRPMSFEQAETDSLGVNQSLVGAYALGLWAFDDDIIRAVAHQADPETSDVVDVGDPLVYVHLARCAANHSWLAERLKPSEPFLKRVGLDDEFLRRLKLPAPIRGAA